MTSAVQATVETTSADSAARRPNARRQCAVRSPAGTAMDMASVITAVAPPPRLFALGIEHARFAVVATEGPQSSHEPAPDWKFRPIPELMPSGYRDRYGRRVLQLILAASPHRRRRSYDCAASK